MFQVLGSKDAQIAEGTYPRSDMMIVIWLDEVDVVVFEG